MKARFFVMAGGAVACAGMLSAVGACAASDDDTRPTTDPGIRLEEPSLDGGSDAPDSAEDADAGPCSDCEYFPATCSDESLCPNGVFDQVNPSAGLDPRTRVNTIRGRSSNDVWLAGALGAVAHFDGTAWTRSDPGTTESLRGIWLRGPAEILLTAMHILHTRDFDSGVDAGAPSAEGWTRRTATTTSYYYAKAMSSAWAADGAEWLWGTMRSMVGSSETGLWRMHFVESSHAFEFIAAAPSGACKALQCSSMTSVHGSSANDVWAVGAFGAAVHITNADGAAPILKPYDTQTWEALYGVWAAAENDVWAVGADGVIRHYTGGPAWDVVPNVPTTEDLNAIWGASSSDIWAVGNKGVALHYDGSTWTRAKIGGLDALRRPDLTTVWMPSPNHVWIGGAGVVLSLGGKP